MPNNVSSKSTCLNNYTVKMGIQQVGHTEFDFLRNKAWKSQISQMSHEDPVAASSVKTVEDADQPTRKPAGIKAHK